MRALLVALLLALVALAGCTDDEPADDHSGQGSDDVDGMDDGDHSGSGTDPDAPDETPSECPEEGPADEGKTADADPGDETPPPTLRQGAQEDSCDDATANTGPVGNFTSDVTEGEVPFDVVFTLDGTDAEGDDLTWTLDVHGDGENETDGTEANLPFEFTWTFTEAGQYTPEFALSDGEIVHKLTLLITAAAPDVPGEEDEGPPQYEDRGHYLFEFATGHCHAKEYDDYGDAGVAYASSAGLGGDWNFVETNGVDGLQLQDNHPLGGGMGLFFDLAVGEDCIDGDQTAT